MWTETETPAPLLSRFLDILLAGGPTVWLLLLVSTALWTLVLLAVWHFARLSRDAGWQAEFAREYALRRTGERRLDMALAEQIGRGITQRVRGISPSILALSTLAPLLGLLGTVLGMGEAFDDLASGSLSLRAGFTSGVGQALFSTQAGLLVAIPGLVAGSVLSRRAERFAERVERYRLALQAEATEQGERT